MKIGKPVMVVFAILVIGMFLILYFAPHETQQQVTAQFLFERIVGFQYALDEGANYDVSWIYRWNQTKIKEDFIKIRNNFPDAHFLRIPIDWYEMNESMLTDHMNMVLDLAEEYGFKVMFVLFNGISGESLENLHPWMLLPQYWSDQEGRLSNIVNAFKSDKRIYAWALGNELNVFQEVVQEWFAHFIPYLKSLDSDTPICTSFYEFLSETPSSVPASTTLGSASKLVSYGLSFIEYHYYGFDISNVSRFADMLTSYCDVPIFISEFGVQGGLNVYDVDTNKQILQDTIVEFEKRLNVIGLSYFLFADADNPNFCFPHYSIWNTTSDSPRAEASVLNSYWGNFLRSNPYAYLEYIKSKDQTEISIYNQLTEYPDYSGWMSWHNHTSFDVQTVTTANNKISDPIEVGLINRGFEMDGSFWSFYPPVPSEFQCWQIVSSPVCEGVKTLKIWANHSESWIGLASYFDGNSSFIRIHDAPQIQNFTQITVEFWVNISDYGSWSHIIDKGWNTTGSWVFYINPTSHCLHWAICGNDGAEYSVVSSALSLNTTYHVVGLYNGTHLQLYVNNVLQGTTAYTMPYFSSVYDLIIGKSDLNDSNYFNGTVDELRIYNRAINTTEIAWSYNDGVGEERPLNKTGLVAWYHFNGEGYDVSPYYYHNDALGVNTVWVTGMVPVHLDDNQFYQLFSVTPYHAYVLTGKVWVNQAVNRGYAFLQISFTRGAYYDWIKWVDSEYVNATTNGWVDIYVSGIAPANADHLQVSCRVRAMESSGYVMAYFDSLKLMQISPVSYDGNSIALAFAKGWNPDLKYHLNYSAVQLTQNVSFSENDVNRIWTFSCKMAVVQDLDYSTGISDWKGVYIGLAFTNSTDLTDPNTKWISWMDDTYLSFNNNFTQLTVKAVPPLDAKAVLMIIKVRLSSWGVFFFDDPHLYCEPMVIPKDFSVPSIIDESYSLTLTVQSINGTNGIGKLVCGSNYDITSCTNCLSCEGSTFTFQIPSGSNQLTMSFTMGRGAFEIWLPIMLFLGIGGALMVAIAPIYIIDKVKSGDWDDAFCWGFLMFIIGIALIIAWLWSG